jgi:hypothetical protein
VTAKKARPIPAVARIDKAVSCHGRDNFARKPTKVQQMRQHRQVQAWRRKAAQR